MEEHAMSRTRRGAPAVLAALALTLAVPATAAAATKPAVTTLGASQVTITTATLTGQVNPHGAATTFYFQYGTTTAYGSRTPSAAVGSGNALVGATAPISGLGPHTKYHYRLVAHNREGTTVGGDRSLTTPRQPLGLALSATPNPVVFGAPSTLAGNLSGTGNAGRPIQLQQNPFPFTGGFANVGNAQLTDPQGGFAFALLSVPLTTQYRVIVTDKPSVVSPVVTVSVQVVVKARVTHTHVRRGAKVRFSGSVRPPITNVPVAIQKLNAKKHWVTVSGTITRAGGQGFVVYGKTLRIKRGGSYRVYVGASGGTFTPNVGRKIRIHTA
jgi:hypothetical protein